jgi:hypothetical protein
VRSCRCWVLSPAFYPILNNRKKLLQRLNAYACR